MVTLKRYSKTRNSRYCAPKRHDYEAEVQSNLSITPSKMLEMAEKGIPVSSQLSGLSFEEGVSKLDFEPPLEHRRGVDMADLWEAREDLKVKVQKAKQRVASGEIYPIVEQAGA